MNPVKQAVQANPAMRRRAANWLQNENAKFGPELQEVPKEKWPPDQQVGLVRLLRSYHFLVQVYAESPSLTRLSINRTRIATATGRPTSVGRNCRRSSGRPAMPRSTRSRFFRRSAMWSTFRTCGTCG